MSRPSAVPLRDGWPFYSNPMLDCPSRAPGGPMALPFPARGRPKEEILAEMRLARDRDVRWRDGRVFGLVYQIGEEVEDLLKEAFTLFFAENGLNPAAFPSLRKFETEVVAMTASLLGGDENVAGTVTSGGTESLLMAVKTARDWGAGYRADVDAARAAINPNTILIVGSAPAYPHGVVDPIADLAALAEERGLLCHVDACVGGFMLPFVRALGYPVPEFDLRVPGVTSISADLHKYGYAAKGASVILYRTPEHRRHQFFIYSDWPGGIYPSPALAGTKPGGPVAAAWALLHFLGWEGYLAITEEVMLTTRKIQAGIGEIPGIQVLGEPAMSVFAIGSDGADVYEVADELALRGWYFDRQHFPPSLHLTVTYAHRAFAEDFIAALADSAAIVRRPSLRRTASKLLIRVANAAVRLLPERWVSGLMKRASSLLGGSGGELPGRSAPMYGMIGTLPNRGDLRELGLDLIDQMTRYQGPPAQ